MQIIKNLKFGEKFINIYLFIYIHFGCSKNLHIPAPTPIHYLSLTYPTCVTFDGGGGKGDNVDVGSGDDGSLCIEI